MIKLKFRKYKNFFDIFIIKYDSIQTIYPMNFFPF